jgi:hypothetical protein
MTSSLTTGLLLWSNGEQLLKKTLAWFASKLRSQLLTLLLYGERVTYDVVLLFFFGLCKPSNLYSHSLFFCTYIYRK